LWYNITIDFKETACERMRVASTGSRYGPVCYGNGFSGAVKKETGLID
jgi:hypothetical protein